MSSSNSSAYFSDATTAILHLAHRKNGSHGNYNDPIVPWTIIFRSMARVLQILNRFESHASAIALARQLGMASLCIMCDGKSNDDKKETTKRSPVLTFEDASAVHDSLGSRPTLRRMAWNGILATVDAALELTHPTDPVSDALSQRRTALNSDADYFTMERKPAAADAFLCPPTRAKWAAEHLARAIVEYDKDNRMPRLTKQGLDMFCVPAMQRDLTWLNRPLVCLFELRAVDQRRMSDVSVDVSKDPDGDVEMS